MSRTEAPAGIDRATRGDTSGSRMPTVAVWDLPTRAFHWVLALLILNAWVSFRYAGVFGDYTLKWHRWSGYAVLVLVVFRLIWGIVGSSTSRFSSFVRGPVTVLGYALDLVRGRSANYLGHNPLGTGMILALLAVVLTQATLGLFTVEHNDTGGDGPLYRLVSEPTYKWLSSWHRWIFYYVVLPLIAAHVTANVLYGLIKRDPLIRAMVTGRKPADTYADEAEARIVDRPMLRALVCLLAAIAIVFGGIAAAGGRLL